MEANAKQIVKDYQTIKTSRMPMEANWDELRDIFFPQSDEIQSESPADAKVDRKCQYTDEPFQALQVLSAGLHSFLTGPTQNWFALKVKDRKLANNAKVQAFIEELEITLRAAISNTNFDTEQDDFYAESACYGSACMYIEEDEEEDLRFNSIPIKDIFWQENARGKIDRWWIRYRYTAYQAVSRFGIENVSRVIQDEYNKSSASDTKYEFIFHVCPRDIRDESKQDSRNMPIASYWIEVDERNIVQEGGFLESPFAYHRFYKRKQTPYGYSPCMMSLKSAKQLNQTLKISLRAMSMAIDGPIDVPLNAYVGKIDLNPGKLLYRKGDEKMTPIRTNSQLAPADWLVNYWSDSLKDGLFNKAIVALGDVTKRMHNLEVSELIAEKMVLLGPAVGRFQEEFAGNVISRSLAILARRGKLPEPPTELGDGFEYKIEFISPLAKAQRNNELQSINAVLSTAGQMSQVTPEVIDNIDPDVTIREVGDVSGATTRIFRTPEKVQEIREARLQAQQQQEEVAAVQEGMNMAQQAQEIDNGQQGSGS